MPKTKINGITMNYDKHDQAVIVSDSRSLG